jgi:hypothetical protein
METSLMETVLLAGAIVLAVGVIVSTIIFRYATTRTVRLTTLIVAAIISVPLLVVALLELFGGEAGPTGKMWAMAVCGILFAFWFKSPFRMLQD